MLSDVPGITVGHASLTDTGVTVIRPVSPHGAVAAVDVRGGGPGTRETDLLAAHNTVERVHAIALCGGSAFGLAAADGAMRELAAQGVGFDVAGQVRVPIVPAAVIFDLMVGARDHYPCAHDGVAAVRACGTTAASGSVGAGCGASAGRLRGGVGQATVQVGEVTVGALVVANPVGEVVDPRTGRLWAHGDYPAVDPHAFAQLHAPDASLNTTIGVVATDAALTPGQARRLALCGHDGIARAIRPAHLPMDGDTLFALSTAEPGATPVDTAKLAGLCAAAATAVESAIADAVMSASPGLGMTAWSEILAQPAPAPTSTAPASTQKDPAAR
ncbi:P1 family peptidase [Corynebacterium uberis]|uniref:P1 family peptidase n=1 Tax=Corynebacterium uberis TaxID=2883169 RepID=UPI001D0B3644|nr:P1 family peptidase [Corynebacterium uberis]UDL73693.1 P1 family peptidase [Corynebacterium uberis]UDL75425.1 P1 family peptidase [Corynebacterium uberis]UDL77638.1 P1 family peptidase [Corynebacterium uberis]UDL79923.1 P1 family peptidase [Corynebacterium uberis]UDL82054.1 P1 family peptidase [Corynebacterium uberis]